MFIISTIIKFLIAILTVYLQILQLLLTVMRVRNRSKSTQIAAKRQCSWGGEAKLWKPTYFQLWCRSSRKHPDWKTRPRTGRLWWLRPPSTLLVHWWGVMSTHCPATVCSPCCRPPRDTQVFTAVLPDYRAASSRRLRLLNYLFSSYVALRDSVSYYCCKMTNGWAFNL